jgi:hypothetical protein
LGWRKGKTPNKEFAARTEKLVTLQSIWGANIRRQTAETNSFWVVDSN